MPRDIRELRDDPEAYAAELRRRWGGLLSYRYIGRQLVVHGRRARRRHGHAPPRHAEPRRAPSSWPCSGIAAPEGGGRSDLEAVPNPVIHSCQVLDPGRDVRRIAVVSEVLKQGRQMGYSRSRIVDAERAGPGAGADAGPGRQHRHAAGRARQDAGGADRRRGRPGPAAAVAGLRRRTSPGRSLGAAGAVVGGRLARRGVAPRSPVRPVGDGGLRPGAAEAAGRRDRSARGALLARDVPRPGQGRSVPGRRGAGQRAPTG